MRRALILILLLAALPAGASSQPPWFHFRSIETPRVTVHYHQELEATARRAAALATEILASHEARYGVHIRRVHLVVVDAEDEPNGFSTPLPYPLVQIHAAAPSGADGFGNYEDWLRLVLTHELAHTVHLDQGRSLVGVGRKLLGRAPYLFPNAVTPTWMIEGLATFEETRGTAFGRGRNPDSRMVLRMAALEGGIPGEDRAATYPDLWPQGELPYLFGEAFLQDLDASLGERALPELARVHSGHILPFLDELTASKVTGATFHARWRVWADAQKKLFEDEAAAMRERGLTVSRPLTRVGIRQLGPRFSPDGQWVAYTSGRLTQHRSIRVMRSDGTRDRRITDRDGGDSVSWTPDGSALVYSEPTVYRLSATYSDLKRVEVASGRKRRLTRGLRASDPDVAADGRRLVFVRRVDDRSELWGMDLDGSALHAITVSAPGTQWSAPRWSPSGEAIVAARWSQGGWLDLALVDPLTGAVTELVHDRARDLEPTFSPDASHVVFRSDRDGVSNLYALRLADGAILRITNVLGGAFDPSVSPDGRTIVFASYSSRGYDLHAMDLDATALEPALAYTDDRAAPRPEPAPVTEASRRYGPLPTMLPRFWSPYLASVSDEWVYGAATAGSDPLFRHVYGAEVHRGYDTGRVSASGFYQYDRFWPTLVLSAEDKKEPDGPTVQRTQQLEVQLSSFIARSFRSAQSLALAWRRKRETLEGRNADQLDLGGLELAYSVGNVRQYPYSISPVEGFRFRIAGLKEAPGLGSEISLEKLTADTRFYLRSGGSGALALRLGAGTTFGQPGFVRSYRIGGFPDGSLFDVVGANLAVLRGYDPAAKDPRFFGRNVVHGNAEYRFALFHPQAGWGSFPLFLRHLHAAVFADAGHAWTGTFEMSDVKTSAGAALGSDVILGHGLPLTGTMGVARGFAAGGETQLYFRVGLAF